MGKPSPITILFADQGEGLGGAEHCLLDLTRRLDPSRFRPVVACGPGPLEAALAADGIETRRARIPRLRGRPQQLPALIGSARELARWVREERASVIHCNTARTGPPAALASLWTGCPWLWHAHEFFGSGAPGGIGFAWVMARLAGRVVAPSRAIARAIPHPGVQVVFNGVALERFDPERDRTGARAALGLPPSDLLIGTVARLNPTKGHDLFLEAAARLRDVLPGAHFVIVGGPVFAEELGAYAAALRARVRDSGLEGRVLFAGHQANVAEWLAAMDLFVYCALSEPFGRVVIEAMAAARAVIAFASGGLPEIVLDGETGRLVPAGDVTALTREIVALAREPARAVELGRRGRARAESLFDIAVWVRAMERVYSDMIRHSSSSAPTRAELR